MKDDDERQDYILLWGVLLGSRVFKNEGLLKVWIWCLLKASYKQRWVEIKTGKEKIEVEVFPGQFVFGRDSAAKDLGMPPSTVWKRMIKLKNMQNLNIKSDRQYSIITIVNWDSYQTVENKRNSQGDRQGTGKEQARNKKDNKGKNKEEDIKILHLEDVRLKDKEYKELVKEHGNKITESAIYILNNYKKASGKKYASDYHALLNWGIREAKQRKTVIIDENVQDGKYSQTTAENIKSFNDWEPPEDREAKHAR